MFHRLLSLKGKVITFITVLQERKKSQITQEHETCSQTFMFYDTPEWTLLQPLNNKLKFFIFPQREVVSYLIFDISTISCIQPKYT